MEKRKYHFIKMFLLIPLFVVLGCSKEEPMFSKKTEQSKELQTNAQKIANMLSVPQHDVNVSLKQAIAATKNKRQPSLRALQSKEVKSTQTLYTSKGKPALYIINFKPEGYAVVSATRKYTPIIAHSDEGSILLDEKSNPSVKELLDNHIRKIEDIDNQPDSLTMFSRLQWEMLGEEKLSQLRVIGYDPDMAQKISETVSKFSEQGYKVYRYMEILGDYYSENSYDSGHHILTSERVNKIKEAIKYTASRSYDINKYSLVMIKENHEKKNIKPLMTTRWGQGYAFGEEYDKYYANSDQYNMYIPNHYPVGCVPVAVAQIMRYHRHPKTFNWDDMPINYPNKTNAKFLYEVAKGVKTKFGRDGSEAYNNDAEKYLISQQYETTIMKNDIYLCMNELDETRPIYSSGKKTNAKNGHAFVIDGYNLDKYDYEIKVMALPDAPEEYLKKIDLTCVYSENTDHREYSKFHINFGWNGSSDGYYQFDDFLNYNDNRAYISAKPKE